MDAAEAAAARRELEEQGRPIGMADYLILASAWPTRRSC